MEKEASATRALPRPAQGRAVLDRYVAAVNASAGEYRALATAAKNGDAAAVSAGLAALRASPVRGPRSTVWTEPMQRVRGHWRVLMRCLCVASRT